MGISVNTETIKDKSLSAVKDVGAATVSVGAGAATYGISYLLSGEISNKFAKQAIEYAKNNNSELFKNAAQKACANEKIFCTTLERAYSEGMSIGLKMLLTTENDNIDNGIKKILEIKEAESLNNKQYQAYLVATDNGTSIASKINSKIDKILKKIISPITNYIAKCNAKNKNGMIEQVAEKLEPCAKKDFVFCDLEKMAMASFHEMGHAKNFRSKGLGKMLQGLKHPLVKKIAIATALLGVLLPPSKKEDEQNKSIVSKAGDFIKDNCVAISAIATVPTVLEEGLASIKGAQIAKKVLTSDKVKMINKMNGKAFLTYLIGATFIPLGIYAAKKVRDALA